MIRHERNQRGSAVLTVLILAAVTGVIAAGFIARAANESRLATRTFFQAAALNLAEAGLEEALFAVNTRTCNAANGWALATGSTTDYVKTISSGLSFAQASGSIRIRVDQAASATPTITAAGIVSMPDQRPIVKQLRAASVGPARLWSNGIVAKGNVIFTGSADVDSYDSSLGDWNSSSNRSDKATVATNATVQLSGSALIYGYVATGGTWPSVGGSGRIYGATSPSNPLVDATRVRTDFNTNLADATAPTDPAYSLGAYTIGGSGSSTLPRTGDLPGPNGRYLYTCTSLSISGSGFLSIKGPVDLIVTGNVTVGGSGYLAIGGSGSTNPSLNLYSPGTVDIGGSGMVNNTATPAKATIWGTRATGSGTQTIAVTGSGAFKGTIYAPNANIALSGSGDVYGAVVGNTVTLSGSSTVHYDVQLGQHVTAAGPNPSTGSAYLRLSSWTELSQAPASADAFARDNRPPFSGLF